MVSNLALHEECAALHGKCHTWHGTLSETTLPCHLFFVKTQVPCLGAELDLSPVIGKCKQGLEHQHCDCFWNVEKGT